MSNSLEKIEIKLSALRSQILLRIYNHLQQKSLRLDEGVHLVDPRAEHQEWMLATVKLTSIETSGKCNCEQAHGQNLTYDLDEFSTDDLFNFLTILEHGK